MATIENILTLENTAAAAKKIKEGLDSIPVLSITFTCTEVSSYSYSGPDWTTFCECSTWEPDKKITYDDFVCAVEYAESVTVANGFKVTSAILFSASVDEDRAGYVYVTVEDGYVSELNITYETSTSTMNRDEDGNLISGYTTTETGYGAGEGDDFTLTCGIAVDVEKLKEESQNIEYATSEEILNLFGWSSENSEEGE